MPFSAAMQWYLGCTPAIPIADRHRWFLLMAGQCRQHLCLQVLSVFFPALANAALSLTNRQYRLLQALCWRFSRGEVSVVHVLCMLLTSSCRSDTP
jgi:hypothetical protein